ncbi:MAG TPA: hypothetical protein VIN09_08435 [Chloroflexota bacterium]
MVELATGPLAPESAHDEVVASVVLEAPPVTRLPATGLLAPFPGLLLAASALVGVGLAFWRWGRR